MLGRGSGSINAETTKFWSFSGLAGDEVPLAGRSSVPVVLISIERPSSSWLGNPFTFASGLTGALLAWPTVLVDGVAEGAVGRRKALAVKLAFKAAVAPVTASGLDSVRR